MPGSAPILRNVPPRGRATPPIPTLMRLASIATVLLLLTRLAPLQAQTPVQPLTLDTTTDHPIAAGDQQIFELPVLEGQVLKIVADQRGADVSLRLEAANVAPIDIDDETKHHVGRELLVWLAPAAGPVRLTVRAKATLSPEAHYRLTATLIGPNPLASAAVVAMNRAIELTPDTRRANAPAAGEQLQLAIRNWHELGDRELEAACLYRFGRLQHRSLQKSVDAAATLIASVDLYDSLGFYTEMAGAIEQLGAAQLAIGQQDKALASYERSYTHAAEMDPVVRAIVEDDMARAWQDLGDLDRAITFGERAAQTFHDAGASRDEFVSLERLALTYSKLRRFDEALQAITRAIELGRQYGTVGDVAGLTVTKGRLDLQAGDEEAALTAYKNALAMMDDNERVRDINTRIFLARLYNRRGESQAARALLEEMLPRVPDQMRDYWAAAACELGVSLTLLGEPQRALVYQQKALDIALASQARLAGLTVLRDISATYRALGDLDTASKMIERADAIARTLPGEPYQAVMLRERARNARAAGDLPAAQRHLDAALSFLDSERGRVQSQALRASLGSTTIEYYGEAIDLAMAMHAQAPEAGYDAHAFELFERSRARSLTDLLAEARVDVAGDLDPGLVAERRELQTELGRKDTVLRDIADVPRNKERISALEHEIDDLARRLEVLDGRMRAANPRYAALTRPSTVSLAETQRLLDDETVLLAWSVGPKSSWGWAITRTSLRSFPLPPASQIEASARRVYADLTARQREEGSSAKIERDLATHAASLSDLVLGPIAGALAGEWRTSRLAIVPTGPLEYIPLAALPAPRLTAAPAPARSTATASARRAWLIDQHEIVQLPSASVLAFLRDDTSAHPAETQAQRVAVLADPVYESDDPRVHRAGDATPIPTAAPLLTYNATRSAPRGLLRDVEPGGTRSGFARLMFSREEAKAIARLGAPGHVVEALDFSASLQTMMSPEIASARIVHIATHGILNSAHPQLSGLVLSLVDTNGRPIDGVLRLYDVFNLKLSADLVVLSGCQTGLGKQMTGEGLIGLTRGFMYAGAPRIVASLWAVDDLATAELMRRFYQGLFTRKLTPAAALAAAQRQMRLEPRWRSPFYWASFTLLGDWR